MQVVGQRGHGIGAGRGLALAVAAQVDGNHAIVVAERLYLLRPQRVVQRKAVHKQHRRPLALILIVHLETVNRLFQGRPPL